MVIEDKDFYFGEGNVDFDPDDCSLDNVHFSNPDEPPKHL